MQIKNSKRYNTVEEIRNEMLDQLQKYSVEAKAIYESGSLTVEEKLQGVRNVANKFCGLANYMNSLGWEVRTNDGLLFTQSISNRINYFEVMLQVDIDRKMQEADK